MFNLVCKDDTWGEGKVVQRLAPVEAFADAKAKVVASVDLQVRALRRRGHPHKVWTLTSSPYAYSVAVEWRPEGPDGIIATIIYEVEAQ